MSDLVDLQDLNFFRKLWKNFRVYTFVDNREVDRYENFKLFLNREDAEKMRDSMGNDNKYFDVHEVEIIK